VAGAFQTDSFWFLLSDEDADSDWAGGPGTEEDFGRRLVGSGRLPDLAGGRELHAGAVTGGAAGGDPPHNGRGVDAAGATSAGQPGNDLRDGEMVGIDEHVTPRAGSGATRGS
jgi:hypothetical protein